MIKFSAIKSAPYKYDYEAIAKSIRAGEKDAIKSYRFLTMNDLFFVVYFVMEIPGANRRFVVERCREVEATKDVTGYMDLWARFHYKMIDINEPVPTPGGFKKHGELKVGDYVFGVDGCPIKVIATTEVFTDGVCFRVSFDKGYSVVVGAEHLWTVELNSRKRINGNVREKRKVVTLNTKELLSEVKRSVKTGSVVAPAVALCKPVKYENNSTSLPVPPYTLGCWLGDGHSSAGRLTCAYSDSGILENIKKEGVRIHETKSSNENCGQYTLNAGVRGKKNTGLTHVLRLLCLKNNKHIPDIYQRSSVQDRIALLQGIMDTDGHCDTRGTATFVNINKRLSEDVFELAAGLGLKPSLRKHVSIINNLEYDFYHVSFQCHADNFPIFRLERKQSRAGAGRKSRSIRHAITSIEPVDKIPCSCIQVDAFDGQYLIGKHFIPTHNSTVITKGLTVQRIFAYPERCTAIFSHTRPTAKKHFRGIKLLLEGSVMLKEWFPDVLYKNPVTEAPKWSEDDGIIVKRRSMIRSESTLEAWGLVEGMPTGSHFDYMMFDDIETDETVNNPEVVETVNRRFDLARNLKTEEGIFQVVGTPYSHLGTYTPFLIEKKKADGGPFLTVRKHAVMDENGVPTLLTREAVEELKATTDPYVFSCQQMVDPTPSAERTFNPDNLKPIEDKMIPKNTYAFMLIDPAGDSESTKADSWAMGVFHVEPKMDDLGQSRIFIKDLVIDQMKTDEATDAAVKMYLRNGMITRLGVEKVGQSTAEIHIASALRAKGRRVDKRDKSLVILTPAGREKKWRIDQALRRPINNGMWHYSKGIHPAYIDRIKMEMSKFPFWHDDGLDIMSYLYDLIKDYRFLPFMFETPKTTNKLAKSYASQ